MFDDVLRELRRLEGGVKVQVNLEIDDNGYLDRLCPSEECDTHFKVMFEDWRNIVRDEVVYCPLCRHDAKASDWNTQEQSRYIQELATSYLQNQLGQALQSDSQRFNSRQHRNTLIQMSLLYRPGHIPIPVPASATDIMTQEFRCSECNCRYSSIGAAFFCPSCGHNSILDTFVNSVKTVRNTLAALPTIREALAKSADENVAEDAIRHICENGLVKLVSSFQHYVEACFTDLANASQFTVRRNLFQNLVESDTIWRDATGTGYTDILDVAEYRSLAMYFQQRHILAHQDGIVDQQYIDRANDQRFDVGQRLIITESAVTNLVNVIEKLATGIALLT